MKKIFSLIKATMSEGMSIFKISTKKKSFFSKIILPIIIALILMVVVSIYSFMIIVGLRPANMEYLMLTIFVILTSFMTLIEGVYKSGNLLFNCKDDNLLLSLPIKKNTVLFLRILKFYIFELLYNAIFLLPAMIIYAVYMKPGFSYYLVSFIGILLLPIIPILLSCIIGTFITFFSTKFKIKNIAQTVFTTIFLIVVLYFSYNFNNYISILTQNAAKLNDAFTSAYYPAGAYIELIYNFNITRFIEFLFINIALFIITIAIIGKCYFSVNSRIKITKSKSKNKKYKIKSSSLMWSLIKKEFSRFIYSPVFVTNSGFGLVLFIIGCSLLTLKFDNVVEEIMKYDHVVTKSFITSGVPVVFLGFLCFTSFMTSITSSMISLEGKSFNILKSLPLKPQKIVKSKILTAVLIMLPFIIIGDIIVFIRFNFDIIKICMILIASVLLPFISETLGILVNLNYPRMDAQNDTEVVKQSMSSSVSVFLGMAIIVATVFILFKSLLSGIPNNTILIVFNIIFTIIYIVLKTILNFTCEKKFENITI